MRLKELREKENLTQAEFAKKYNITRATYANYENGKTQPDFKILKKLAEQFNVSIDYLLGHKTKQSLDLSAFSEAKTNLLKMIAVQDDLTCQRLEGLIYGYLNSYEQTKQHLQNNYFKKFDT